MTEDIIYALAIRTLREARGLSASKLSRLAGLPDYTVSRIETGKLSLDFATAVALANELNISLNTIVSTAIALPPELIEKERQVASAKSELKTLRKMAGDLSKRLDAD